MRRVVSTGFFSVLVSMLLLFGPNVSAASKKPTILEPCKQCHDAEQNYLRGKLKSVSRKAQTLQVFTGSVAWQVTFDKSTLLDGAKKVNKIGKNKEIGIEFEKKGGVLYAKSIDVKQPADIPQEWIIGTKEMKRLLDLGPVKGNYSLYDARPGKLYLAGHIPGAVMNYDAKFAKNIKKLPKDKDKLVVFYCGGDT